MRPLARSVPLRGLRGSLILPCSSDLPLFVAIVVLSCQFRQFRAVRRNFTFSADDPTEEHSVIILQIGNAYFCEDRPCSTTFFLWWSLSDLMHRQYNLVPFLN